MWLQRTFYEDLETYLVGPGARFFGDVAYVEEKNSSSGIFAARSEVTWLYLEESRDLVRDSLFFPPFLMVSMLWRSSEAR